MRTNKSMAVFALTGALAATLLAGCSDNESSSSATDAPAVVTTAPPSGSSVIGLLESASTSQVVLNMGDGTKRTFKVKEEDRAKLGIPHLASHAGLTDIGFRVTYVTEGGTDYIKSASESSPPTTVAK